MSLPVRETPRGRPRLTIVRGTHEPVHTRAEQNPAADWRRVASAALACTHELARHLHDQRWVRVDEVLRERRELLAGLARMRLDGDARSCLRALEQAADESERAIATMMGTARKRQ